MNDPARAAAVKAALLSITLPDVCGMPDVARALHLPLHEAEKVVRDEAIPGRWMGGRWFTTRWALLDYIAPSREAGPVA